MKRIYWFMPRVAAVAAVSVLTGEMVLENTDGGMFFNAGDAGNHVAAALFIVGENLQSEFILTDQEGSVLVISGQNQQHAFAGAFGSL
jgi:hypothetical protein